MYKNSHIALVVHPNTEDLVNQLLNDLSTEDKIYLLEDVFCAIVDHCVAIQYCNSANEIERIANNMLLTVKGWRNE